MPRLTIHDLAALAGVSAGTVSRALNGQAGVGERTRARIAALAAEHGFKAQSSARQLSTGRTRTLGIVFPLQVSEVVIHPVYPELLGALGDAAQARGYDVMMFTVSSPAQVDHVVDAVERRRVDGVVLPAAGPRDPLIRRLESLDSPTVLIGHRRTGARMGWVDSTHDVAARQLTAGIIGRDRRRLVLLTGPSRVSAFRLRARGFWDAVEVARVVDAEQVDLDDTTAEAGRAAAAALLARPTPPDAVVCASDGIASGVLEAAREAGVTVPDLLEVSGFDDAAFAVHTAPQLTTVRMPLRELGEAAVQMLVGLLDDSQDTPHEQLFPAEVIERGSTGC